MAGNLSSTDDDIISAINVTPLVDVVLVLLIIFMITAPVLYQTAIKVQLPQAKTGEEVQKSGVTFTLTKDGEVAMNGEKLSWDELSIKIKFIGKEAASQPVVVSADRLTSHGNVVKLMDLLRQHGLTKFSLNVDSAVRK